MIRKSGIFISLFLLFTPSIIYGDLIVGNGGVGNLEGVKVRCGYNVCGITALSGGVGFGATRKFVPGFLFKVKGGGVDGRWTTLVNIMVNG